MSDIKPPLYLLGCGATFEAIASAWTEIAPERSLTCCMLPGTDAIAQGVVELLRGVDPAAARVFIAVDQNALNFARLDLYRQVRLLGFRGDSLVHPRAVLAPGVKLGENCWIAAAAVLSGGVRLGNNSFVGAAARLDANVHIAAHAWIGAGASVGLGASVGSHTVLGADVHVAANVRIGRYCVVDVPGAYRSACADGTFVDALFPLPVRMYGSPSKLLAKDAGAAP
jgi:carbonic anhydrase/acetyltransferase-like protein (isoleucine patch superfamily)